MSPFFMECRVDTESVHEVLHVTVPTHILLEHGTRETINRIVFPRKLPELTIAESILTDIFENDDALREDSVKLLAKTALTLIGNALRCDTPSTPRQTISERRIDEVQRFIEVNLSNPELSSRMVATGCGISPRYLSTLLAMRGTSFSKLMWSQRLAKAKHAVAIGDAREVTIAEICYSLGFKSPAHFSRLFKRVFKVNPSDYRHQQKDRGVDEGGNA
jgi:AraC-like DNA-binding protein